MLHKNILQKNYEYSNIEEVKRYEEVQTIMIKIAICDDDAEYEQAIEELLDNWMVANQKPYGKQRFLNSKNLLYEIEDGMAFDVVLLDIEMPQLDGIALTEKIKAILPDVLVIFITLYERYVYKTFRVQPFRFIPKKSLENMLPMALKDAVEWIEKCEGKYLYIENQERMEKIPTRSITYIYHREKYTYVETTGNHRARVRKTLRQIYEELPQEDFVWIDKGCICNLLQISQIDNRMVLLTDGTRHPISRDRLTEVKSILRKYWIGEGK